MKGLTDVECKQEQARLGKEPGDMFQMCKAGLAEFGLNAPRRLASAALTENKGIVK